MRTLQFLNWPKNHANLNIVITLFVWFFTIFLQLPLSSTSFAEVPSYPGTPGEASSFTRCVSFTKKVTSPNTGHSCSLEGIGWSTKSYSSSYTRRTSCNYSDRCNTFTMQSAPKLCPANSYQKFYRKCKYFNNCDTYNKCLCNTGFEAINNSCVPICGVNQARDALGVCVFTARVYQKNRGSNKSCNINQGNPINIATGNKYQSQSIYSSNGPWPLELSFHYNSQIDSTSSIGEHWQTNFDRKLVIGSTREGSFFRPDGKIFPVRYHSIDDAPNYWRVESLGVVLPRKLTKTASSWQYFNENDEIETFDISGKLISITNRQGKVTSLSYDLQNRLAQVISPSGQTLTFSYDAQNRIQQILTPSLELITLNYDTNSNLASITWPDGNIRQFHYEDNNFMHALTGVTSEDGQRFSTYAYDTLGRAISSEHAGGVDKISVNYITGPASDGSSIVTDALGATREHSFKVVQGVANIENTSQSCTTCSGNIANNTYDDLGNVLTQTDFRGVVKRFTYNASGYESRRVEAEGTPEARITHTEWHAVYRLPTRIAKPHLITTFTRDTRGNLLTRREQATIDATGASGFAATASGAPRIWTYTNNTDGQPISVNGPRTDVNDITQYTYDTNGNIATITDAIGRVTTLSYNVHGKLLSVQSPSGAVTNMTYDNRQRLVSSSQDGITSSFSYDANGNLITTTRADGSQLNYQYDAANRVTQIRDSLGNRIQYTLDAKGNITQQDVQDPSGTLTQTHQREFNLLNQLSKDISALGHATQYAYDANGNLTQTTNPLGLSTTNVMDALNRTAQTTDTAGGITQYQYDANDRITKVIDPRNLETSYTYNGYGEILSITSPDTGNTTRTYDTAGNQLTETDARSKTTTYTYDALNRLKSSTDAENRTVQYAYDITGGIASITEPHTTLSHTYTPAGRLLSKTQTIGTVNLHQSYTYNVAGQLQSYTYPSGAVLQYQYNANGQLQSITATVNGNTHTVADNIQYQPFGGITQHTNLANQTQQRQYDLDGRVSSYTQAGQTITLEYDAQSRITAIAGATQINDYVYDNLDRLTGHIDAQLHQHSYQYDANSNRTSKTSNNGTQLYSYPSNSHRLAQVGSQTYSYDAAGNTTSDGTQQFTYNAIGRMATSINPAGVMTSYQYNALGQRIKKQNVNEIVHSAYDPQGHMIGEYDNNGIASQETIWLYDTPIAVIKQHQLYAIHADHLDTPRLITNSTNQATWAWPNKEAFGNNPANEDPNNTGNLFSYNLRFPGQLYDSETKTHYNYLRDSYSPDLGRYYQSDPIGLEGGINTYGYVGGNPLSYVDHHGLNASVGVGVGALLFCARYPSLCVAGGYGLCRLVGGCKPPPQNSCNIDDGPLLATPPDNAYDPNGPKAPGKPGTDEGFSDPKDGENWVKNPNSGQGGGSHGWEDSKGDVWVPTGQGGRAHGGPHWDVQTPGGGYRNVRPVKK